MRESPALLVLAGVAAGLGLVTAQHWRLGLYVVGLALLLGGALRASLPERAAGLLAVRGRTLDTVLLMGLGAGVIVLTNSVPAA